MVLLAAGCALLPFASTTAKPSGFHLKTGDALPRNRDESGTILIQSGKNAIIDWESFSISQDERVRFQQTGVDSYVLNRVVGSESSALFGTLQSNGAVYLINPNGILIGPNALIETAASSLPPSMP